MNTQSLNVEQIARIAPSVFATEAHASRSDRYTFISTQELIRPLMDQGWLVTQASQRSTRKNGRDPGHTRHMLRMRMNSAKPVVGDTIPEVILTNSHDGQSLLSIYAGLFRLVCSNGMVVSTTDFGGTQIRHRGDIAEALDQVHHGIDLANQAIKTIPEMQKVVMTAGQQFIFAKEAAALVYNEPDWDIRELLKVRRVEDEGDTVWNVFNRVQENLVRGGLKIQHTTGTRRRATTRGLTHIGRSIDVNLALWQLAMSRVQWGKAK